MRTEQDTGVVFGRPLISEEAIAEVGDALRSGWIGAGPRVARFERELGERLGGAHVRCVASGTAALYLILRAHGIGPGDEVLLPSLTFVACASAIELTGAAPVLVDSEPGTNLISLEAAERAVTQRTRAVMLVHLAGRPVDLDGAARLRERHGLLVVEDAAHAIGAHWDGTPIGGGENPVAFSFHATKNITSVEGGAVATRDPALAERVEQMARHGLDRSGWDRFSDAGSPPQLALAAGFKFTMSDVQAALALHQLPQLDEWIAVRERQWSAYDAALAGLALRTPPPPGPRMRHARHLYQVSVAQDRDGLAERLGRRGIGTGLHYRALHLHPHFRGHGELPVATHASRTLLSLPLGPAMSEDAQARVIETLRDEL
jgi:dTDP-4-amino-4,6-dideoxygalactose transaminase